VVLAVTALGILTAIWVLTAFGLALSDQNYHPLLPECTMIGMIGDLSARGHSCNLSRPEQQPLQQPMQQPIQVQLQLQQQQQQHLAALGVLAAVVLAVAALGVLAALSLLPVCTMFCKIGWSGTSKHSCNMSRPMQPMQQPRQQQMQKPMQQPTQRTLQQLLQLQQHEHMHG
jgi:hypothetical protein